MSSSLRVYRPRGGEHPLDPYLLWLEGSFGFCRSLTRMVLIWWWWKDLHLPTHPLAIHTYLFSPLVTHLHPRELKQSKTAEVISGFSHRRPEELGNQRRKRDLKGISLLYAYLSQWDYRFLACNISMSNVWWGALPCMCLKYKKSSPRWAMAFRSGRRFSNWVNLS